MWKLLPNIITLVRILLIPIFVVLMVSPSEEMLYAAIGVFITAAVTDYIDGFLARKWNVVTKLGKLLDPLADKILVLSALVMLVAQRSDFDGAPWIPGWIVVLVLAREIWVTGLRSVAAASGVVVAAGSSGKVKSFLQMIAIVFLLLHHQKAFMVQNTTITCQHVGVQLMIASLVFSYWGAVEYTMSILSAENVLEDLKPSA